MREKDIKQHGVVLTHFQECFRTGRTIKGNLEKLRKWVDE